MPLVIALTGGIGSGKTSVADMLGELGAAVIDTDAIAHRLTAAGEPGARAIGEVFGAQYLAADGALDRKRMRELVFADPLAKKQLEDVLHPMIRAEVGIEMSTAADATAGHTPAPYIVLVVPLLVETGAYRNLARRVLVVDCDERRQVARVVERSALTQAAVQAIMANQASRAQRLSYADDVVQNDGDLAALRTTVAALHCKYLALSNKPG